jgi:hypothetical protein
MDISRVPPFPLSVTYSGLVEGQAYIFTVLNEYGQNLWDTGTIGDAQLEITVELPDYFSRYDADYRVEIYEMGSYPDPIIYGPLVVVDTLSIRRPYIDVVSSLTSPDEIAEAEEYEAVVRAIIDAHTDGFSFKRSMLDLTGNGSDFLPIMHRMTKVVRVYENNVLVYDVENEDPDWSNITEYSISRDRTSIIESVSGEVNKYESKPFKGREVGSDSFTTADYPYEAPTKVFPETTWASFPDGWDYSIVIEHGYPVIPQDIQKAAKMLYADLKCGNIQYRNSYIKEYESVNQFKIKIDERSMNGTGNILVDNILSKYPKMITGIGVI